MRDIKRMKPFLAKRENMWKEKCPDWRFGQLMFNFLSEVGDPFHWEEDTFIEKLTSYLDNI